MGDDYFFKGIVNKMVRLSKEALLGLIQEYYQNRIRKMRSSSNSLCKNPNKFIEV